MKNVVFWGRKFGNRMAHYLNPNNDLTFKKIFGEHKDICKVC
jgi:hypothetical protein